MNHDLNLTPVDVAEGRAVMVTCPDCGQLEVWSEAESNDHGLCRAKGGACWCDPETKRAVIREALANCEKWIGGAAIVKSGGGQYTTWPGAYEGDISFSVGGLRVYQIDRLADVTGDDRKWPDLAEDEQAWAVDQVAAAF